jgi:hypothetical protein
MLDFIKKLFSKKETMEQKPENTPVDAPPWYKKAKEHDGVSENNSKFASLMVPLWKKLFKRDLNSISKYAWCGLGMAAALFWSGQDWQMGGEAARNWGKYGDPIEWKTEGIPRGAIIWVNHSYNCNSSKSNHVAQADGDCAAVDLLKSGARINLYGGNQSNSWKVSSFPVKEICAVRWPKNYPKPPKVIKSVKCSGSSGASSTR